MDDVGDLMMRQQKREIELVSSFKQCNLTSQFNDANDIKQELMKANLDEKFYDAKIMGALFCIFDSILLTPGTQEASDIIQQLIPELRRIGAESVEGYALMAKFGELKDTLIVKVTRNPKNDNLFHEYFVGVSATNKLRMNLPNFAYILGAFKCGGAVIAPDKKVERWCSKSGSPGDFVNYVIYEKIPGKSIKDEVAKCTPVEYFSWILQAAIAIQTGADMYGFTHYDLHDENALMREWNPQDKEYGLNAESAKMAGMFFIPYLIENEKVYIRTNKITTFIDYGRSRVEVNGESFGAYGFENFGIEVGRARPGYDLYKLLGFSLNSMLAAKNYTTFDACYKFYQIFIDSNMRMSKKDVIADLKSVPPGEEMNYFEYKKDMNLWDWLDMVKSNMPDLWRVTVHSKPNGQVLQCESFCPASVNAAAESLHSLQNAIAYSRSGSSRALEEFPISQYEYELSQMRDSLNSEFNELGELSLLGIPKSLSAKEFEGFLSTYVEPQAKLYGKVKNYKQRLELLDEYNEMMGIEDNLSEYMLSEKYKMWQRKYDETVSRLARTYVPESKVDMKEALLEIL